MGLPRQFLLRPLGRRLLLPLYEPVHRNEQQRRKRKKAEEG